MSKIFEAVDKFFSSFANYLNYNRYFIIFSALFLFTVICVVFSTSHSYESRLIKAVDMFNNYFLDNPQITEDNLIAFNNKMKSSRVPKQLRKQWQQYVLYREDKASKYMSFDSCVTIPVKNSTYTRDVRIMNMLAYIFAGLCFLFNLYCSYEDKLIDILQHCLLCPILILMLNYLVTIFFQIRHNAIISDLYSNYQYFEVNIDKATETLPDYVDYEVLFDRNEIKRGIPILYAYLQKRAEEEKKELERARLRNVEHEKFNFDEAGVERSLVLERAMAEAENYIAERKKLMQDMEQINNEVYQEENSFRETTKEYQRQMQVSKESFDNFKQQLEDVTSSIEANYLKKQQQQELDRQRNLERDYDTATDRHKKVLESYQAEITDIENQIKKARNVLEKSMMSEFDTYSGKVYDEALRVVEEREADKYSKVQDNIKSLEERLQHKEAEVNGLYDENAQLKDQLSQIDAEYQQKLNEREQIISRVSDEVNRAKTDMRNVAKQEQPEEYDVNSQYAGDQYDVDQYYNQYVQDYDNQQYDNQQYDNQQSEGFYDNQQYATSTEPSAQVQPEQTQVAQEVQPQQETYTFNYLDEPDEQDGAHNIKPDFDNELETFATHDEQTSVDSGETADEKNLNSSSNTVDYFDEPDTTFETDVQEDNQVEESTVQTEESKPKGKPGRPRKIITEPVVKRKPGRPRKQVVAEPAIQQHRKPGRPKKIVTEQSVETQPKRKAGRPKKQAPTVEQTRSVGRPRKTVAEQPKKVGRPRKVEEAPAGQPQRKAGRPKKIQTTETKPAGRPGRPKKVQTEQVVEIGKRKAGRPKKVDSTANNGKKPVGRPKKVNVSQPATSKSTNSADINDLDEFLKQIDTEIAKENAKLEATKKELEKNTKFKDKKG